VSTPKEKREEKSLFTKIDCVKPKIFHEILRHIDSIRIHSIIWSIIVYQVIVFFFFWCNIK